ncbi:MAG: hypothetical protein ABFD52_05010 [Acidobacteriota bacterium]
MRSWLLDNKDIIMTLSNLILALAAAFVIETLRLQRKATQAAMFSDIGARISSILAETPKPEEGLSDQHNWIVRLLNELEALVFLANAKLLSRKMKRYYEDFILGWIDDLPENYPDAAKSFTKKQKGGYQELDRFYQIKRGQRAHLFSGD